MKKSNIPAITFSLLLALAITLAFSGCATTQDPAGEEEPTVMNITAEEGKTMMEEDPTIVLVDVRTQEEFIEEHIPGALLVPVDELESLAPEMMPDKEATYIIYCRSGNRSATAAQQLIDMGYKNIYDMGGIIDWPYETETGL
jgi:rhodanese-related sulfurtransferase